LTPGDFLPQTESDPPRRQRFDPARRCPRRLNSRARGVVPITAERASPPRSRGARDRRSVRAFRRAPRAAAPSDIASALAGSLVANRGNPTSAASGGAAGGSSRLGSTASAASPAIAAAATLLAALHRIRTRLIPD
jgi:hypothetical protein